MIKILSKIHQLSLMILVHQIFSHLWEIFLVYKASELKELETQDIQPIGLFIMMNIMMKFLFQHLVLRVYQEEKLAHRHKSASWNFVPIKRIKFMILLTIISCLKLLKHQTFLWLWMMIWSVFVMEIAHISIKKKMFHQLPKFYQEVDLPFK